MLRAKPLCVVFCLGLALGGPPSAGQQVKKDAAKPAAGAVAYEIDNVHSSFMFRADHAGIGYVFGRFNTISGHFSLNADKPASNTFEVNVDVKSVETNNPDRNKHLLSAEFFDVEKFPKMTFKTKSVTPAKSGFTVIGDFSMHGVTKEITLDLQKVGEGVDPFGLYRAGCYAELTIKRSDYGMDQMMQAVGDEVHLYLAFEGLRQ